MRYRNVFLLLATLSLAALSGGCDRGDDDNGGGKAPCAIVAMDNGVTGYEPYRYDGKSFTLLKDISPGGSSDPMNFCAAGGKVYFTAAWVDGDRDLWVTDGTPAGTHLVMDINPRGESFASNLCALGDRLLFTADDGVHGAELWVTDGTEAGTTIVRDICPGSNGSTPFRPVPFGGKACFSADDGSHGRELWVTDGTEAGTTMVKDIDENPFEGSLTSPQSFAVLGRKLYFAANDGVHGYELWGTDGTEGGTVLVADINPNDLQGSGPEHLTAFDGKICFAADDGVHGVEPWISDGTADGTKLLADANLSGASNSRMFTPCGGRLFFVATDGGDPLPTAPGPSASSVAGGSELWVTDGTTAGTRMVKDINPLGGSDPAYLADHKGVLYFGANDGTRGWELWKSDGTGAGTALVKDLNAESSYPCPLPALASPSLWNGPWVYLSGDFDRLLFAARDDVHGFEVWSSDGTDAGTALVEDFRPGPGNGFWVED